MSNPIKVIHKYTNNNAKTQYNVMIYIGEVEDNVMTILNKITDLDLYQTWMTLTKKEIKVLTDKYGEQYYKYFFLQKYLDNRKKAIKKDNQLLGDLMEKYGQDWIDTHLSIENVSLTRSYSRIYGINMERKISTKLLRNPIEEVDIIDYREEQDPDIYAVAPLPRDKPIIEDITDLPLLPPMIGGDDVEFITDDEYADDIDFIPENLDSELFDDRIEEEELDFDSFFNNDETDENLKQTTKDIKNAISNRMFEKINQGVLNFDASNDNSYFDASLSNTYNKHYVTNQYIYYDDTIQKMKSKICCSFKNNSKFGENYLIPSYQYLWSEYELKTEDGKVDDKVMIGQQWVIRNNLMNINIEPVQLSYYEELVGKLRQLRDTIKRSGKIRREDESNNLISDYQQFITNGELFMIDIYNELGLNYKKDNTAIHNVLDTFIKIYFPKISSSEFNAIIANLQEMSGNERSKMTNIFDTLNNDLILENEIMKTVETIRENPPEEFSTIFKNNLVTQTLVRVQLFEKLGKIDLFRIFDKFEMNELFPFCQYCAVDGVPKYKFSDEYLKIYSKTVNVTKWFETAPLGISFKMKIIENGVTKFMTINLNETGRIDHKITWKEDDMSVIEDIEKTYHFIREIVRKINKENPLGVIVTGQKGKLNEPSNDQFSFALITTIQRFELPNNAMINHNDLSEFSRYFYPYVALVIQPKKRQTLDIQTETKSKFGTYLRYKRVTKYENRLKIEQRILFFIRNYEYTNNSLADEISREFNITEEQAMVEIKNIQNRFPNLSTVRKNPKKMINIPKFKQPGINVDIQGKTRDKLKIRINGARSEEQLRNIITFMNVLIYLYIQTYVLKKPEYQRIRKKLEQLTNIARRRNKVEELIDESNQEVNPTFNTVNKKLTVQSLDGLFLSWRRLCQNSGNDKKRRPQEYTNEDDLKDMGYVWVNKLGSINFGHYEKKVTVKKGKEITLIAAKMPLNETESVYYTCNPEDNGRHMYIGFLGKNESQPCCFIKNHLDANNKEKRDLFLSNLGAKEQTVDDKKVGDQLYILQESGKIPAERMGFLPKYLDIFFNAMLGNENIIKFHHLSSTKPVYYFKYGVELEVEEINGNSQISKNVFLSAIGTVLDVSQNTVKQMLVTALENDKTLNIFTSLNNGNIKTQFGDIKTYINYIKNADFLSVPEIGDLVSTPGVLLKEGVNLLIYQRKTKNDGDKVQELYYPICVNYENNDKYTDPTIPTFIIVKEGRYYYPIISASKSSADVKDVIIEKIHFYEDKNNNVVKHSLDFHTLNCKNNESLFNLENRIDNAKQARINLINKNIKVLSQVLDSRNKAIYLQTDKGIVPVLPSGSIYDIPIIELKNLKKRSLDETVTFLRSLSYDVEFVNNLATSTVLILTSGEEIPIIPINITPTMLKKYNLVKKNQTEDDQLNNAIKSGKMVVDTRVDIIGKSNYSTELYELFRYHLSYFLSLPKNESSKNELMTIIDSDDTTDDKREKIKTLLYENFSAKLLKVYLSAIKKSQKGGSLKGAINITTKYPDTNNYVLKNHRVLCDNLKNEDCSCNINCTLHDGKCKLSIPETELVDFVNKVTEELIRKDLQYMEIMQVGNYFVSDISNFNIYQELPGERVIVKSNLQLDNIIDEITKDNTPILGKVKINKRDRDTNQLNIDNPLREFVGFYYQNIYRDNLSIFRTFTNCYYWLKNPYYEIEYRNLGYFSTTQTELSNQYHGIVIDWLTDENNAKKLNSLVKYTGPVDNFAVIFSGKSTGMVELAVLSRLYKVAIIVQDQDLEVMYIFSPVGMIYHNSMNIDIPTIKIPILNIRYTHNSSGIVTDIDAMYAK